MKPPSEDSFVLLLPQIYILCKLLFLHTDHRYSIFENGQKTIGNDYLRGTKRVQYLFLTSFSFRISNQIGFTHFSILSFSFQSVTFCNHLASPQKKQTPISLPRPTPLPLPIQGKNQKEKAVSHKTAHSVMRGLRDVIMNNFCPRILQGFLGMGARFEVMRERMERVMAQ